MAGGTTNFDNVAVPAGGVITTADADGFRANNVKLPDHLVIVSKFTASTVDEFCFVADRACQVTGVREIHSVVGGSSAAVRPRKITDTSAPGAAAGATVKELTTAALDLTATINTLVTGTLSATPADLLLAAGDRIGLDFSGTLTGLVGMIEFSIQFV